MKKLLLVILFAGILVGPGYLLYCVQLSGSTVGSYPLFSQDVNFIGIGQNKTVKASNKRWHTPISIELFPEMNTIAFNIAAKFVPPVNYTAKKIYYLLSLTKKGEIIWEEEFFISSKKKKGKKDKESIKIIPASLSKGVKTFNVNEGGEYELDIKQKTESKIVVSDLKLKVRQNVTIPQKNVYLPGFVLLGGALIGLIVVGKKKT